jgi:hypothetical protein
LQPFAPGQVAASGCSSGCKWLQVAAGGKWLQVAGFLKIKKNASCVLNEIFPTVLSFLSNLATSPFFSKKSSK